MGGEVDEMQNVNGLVLRSSVPRGAAVVVEGCYPDDRVAGAIMYAYPDAKFNAVQYYFLVDRPLEADAPVPTNALLVERYHFRLLQDAHRPRHEPIQL